MKTAMISVHRKACRLIATRQCVCKELRNQDPTKSQGYVIIEGIMSEMRAKNPKSNVLLRYLIVINLYRRHNLYQAALLHQLLTKRKQSLSGAIMLFKVGDTISERLALTQQSSYQNHCKPKRDISFSFLLHFERGFCALKENMIKVSLSKEAMMSEIEDSHADIKELVDKTSKFIFKQSEVIHKEFYSLIKIKRDSTQLLVLYYYFNSIVLNLKSEAKKTLYRLQSVKDDIARKLRIKSGSENAELKGFISVSMEPGKVGEIKLVGQYALNMLNYTKDELMGKNLNYILPDYLIEKHSNFLQQYGKSTESKVINKKRLRFFIDKGGFLVLSMLEVKFHFTVENGIEMIGTLYEQKPLERYQQRNKLLYYFSYNQVTGDIGYVCKNCAHYLGF